MKISSSLKKLFKGERFAVYCFAWLPISVPFVLLIRILKPLVLIRFSDFMAQSMGMMTSSFAIYLCQPKNDRVLDFFFYHYSCNPYFIKISKRQFKRIYRFGYWFFKSAEWFNRRLIGGQIHEIYSRHGFSDRDLGGFLDLSPTQFEFSEQEKEIGAEFLERMGLKRGDKFVCLIVRDDAYFKTLKPELNDYENQYRNSSIDSFEEACKYLVSQDYYVFRMGAMVEKPLGFKHPKVIDYAWLSLRTDFLDFYLAAKCDFCISTVTGWDAVPSHVFRKPMVYVNWAHIGKLHTYSDRFLILMKKMRSLETQKILGLSEIFQDDFPLRLCQTSQLWERRVELVENSPQEIRDIVQEMVERLDGTWVEFPKDSELQFRFWELYVSRGKYLDGIQVHGDLKAKYGAKFLRENQEWIGAQI